jgi:hypothetical protein
MVFLPVYSPAHGGAHARMAMRAAIDQEDEALATVGCLPTAILLPFAQQEGFGTPCIGQLCTAYTSAMRVQALLRRMSQVLAPTGGSRQCGKMPANGR